jgi:hypothetical protein
MHIINALLLAAMALTSVFQDTQSYEWNKKSTLTAEGPVEFPGIVLDPGVYVVKLKESGDKRSVVEILNTDESKVLASVVAIPDHRMKPDDNAEFVFHEVKSNGPTPVRSWFYSGDLVGLEFIYPKPRAKQIAQDTDDHVMASNDSSKESPIVAVTPNGREIVIEDPAAVQTARRKPQ